MAYLFQLIKSSDFFGPSINFTIRNDTNFKTVFGGLISIIVYALYIFFFVLFGKDMIFNLNPTITLDTLTPDLYEEYKIDENLFFAWKIDDVMGNSLKDDLFKAKLYYSQFDNIKNVETYNTYLSMLNCTDKKFDKNFNGTHYDRVNWTCFDFSKIFNMPLYGTFSTSNVSYLGFDLDICDNDNNQLKFNCKDYKQVRKKLSKQITLLSTLTYEVDFKPDNFKDPLDKQLSYYSNNINVNLQKLDFFYFQNTKVQQDDAILFSNERQITNLIGIEKINRFPIFKTDEELDEYYSNNNKYMFENKIYTLLFFFDNDYKKYTRKYMKIQDVFGNVNGFMEFLILILNFIKYYTDYRFDYYLFNQFVNVKVQNKSNFITDYYKINNFKLNQISDNNKISKELNQISRDIKVNINEENKCIKNEVKDNSNKSKELSIYTGKHTINQIMNLYKNDSITKRNLLNQTKVLDLNQESYYKNNLFSKETSSPKDKINENENEVQNLPNDFTYKDHNKILLKLEKLLNSKTKYLFPILIDYFFSNFLEKFKFWKNKKRTFDLKLLEIFKEKIYKKFDISFYLRSQREFKNLKRIILKEKNNETVFKLFSKNLYEIKINDSYEDNILQKNRKHLKIIFSEFIENLKNSENKAISTFFIKEIENLNY